MTNSLEIDSLQWEYDYILTILSKLYNLGKKLHLESGDIVLSSEKNILVFGENSEKFLCKSFKNCLLLCRSTILSRGDIRSEDCFGLHKLKSRPFLV